MSALVDALSPVALALEGLGVASHVGGSVASSFHGALRATFDVDLVADLAEPHVAPLVAALAEQYYVDDGTMRDAIRERSSFNLIHLATMFKVDVFLPRREYDLVALARARRVRLGEGAGAREIPLATPEDSLLSKLDWYRRGGEVSERQWGDILGILRVL